MATIFLPTTLRKAIPRPAIGRRYLQSNSSLAPAQLSFAFDIDGVLKRGEKVIPGATRALKLLESKKIPFLLLTNGGGAVTESERIKLLSHELQIDLAPTQLVQSHTPLRRSLATRFADEPVLVVGGKRDACRKIAESYGLKKVFTPSDVVRWNPAVWPFKSLSEDDLACTISADFSTLPFKACLVFPDGRDWGLDIQVISDILQSENGIIGTRRPDLGRGKQEVEVVFSNPDLIWGNDFPCSRYGTGAFKTSLLSVHKEATGHDIEYVQLGKPHKATYDFAQAMLETHLKEMQGPSAVLGKNVYMVGDNPASDISGAVAFGWKSLLVRTGVFKGGEPDAIPTRIVNDVEEGVRWALEKEGLM